MLKKEFSATEAAADGKIHTKGVVCFCNAAEIVFPFGGVSLCTPAEKRRSQAEAPYCRLGQKGAPQLACRLRQNHRDTEKWGKVVKFSGAKPE
jgi:hypothetical protein